MGKDEKLQRLRQAGLFAKGTVYVLLGGLAAMAALGAGGDTSGKKGVVRFLLNLPLGKVLVSIVAVGLLAYCLWRLYEAWQDPRGNGETRWGKKLQSLYSGLFYGFVAFSFAKALFSSSSSGGGSKKAMLAQVLDKSWGAWVVGAIALVVLGSAIYQFYRGYSGKFMKKLDEHPNQRKTYLAIKRTGQFGYCARGVVFGILAFFLFKVMADHNADQYKGTQGVFQYLLSLDFGALLMGAVAVGLVAYGVFIILVGRYSQLTKVN